VASPLTSMSKQKSVFRHLHENSSAFIIPNPWDAGSARILACHGFKALATTSAGMAFALGLADGQVSREAAFAHCRQILAATSLPVSADLERGFGDSPEAVAQTIRDAGAIGLAGCSIEDHTGSKEYPIYDFGLAVERMVAAVEAARNLPNDFVLTARCENLLWGKPNLDEVIARLQAFEKAGADVLFAPGLRDLDSIRTVCSAVAKPVNVVMESHGKFSLAELAAVGVKRVSTGASLARLAYGGLAKAAQEMSGDGSFGFAAEAMSFDDVSAYFVS
jgi:2-methylisocitrate lyase-like PEP mutase family enzyme